MRTRREMTVVMVTALMALVLVAGSSVAGPPVQDGQVSLPITLAGTVASKISYQGRLTDVSGNPLEGSHNLVFQLWDDATAGNQVGSNIVKTNVPMSSGLFTVELDVPQAAFNGQALWLRIQVDGQWLSPRQELLPVPYALYAVNVPQHDHFGQTWSGSAVSGLQVLNTASSGLTSGLHGQSDSSSDWARGVYGYTSAASGLTIGVYGETESSSDQSRGVFGRARGLSGATYGVYGRTDSSSNNAAGVYGYTSAISGTTYGVYGRSDSDDGYGGLFVAHRTGMRAQSVALSGTGVHAVAGGSNGTGVYAEGGAYGVHAEGSTGVYGQGILGVRAIGTGSANSIGLEATGEKYAAIFRGTVLVQEFSTGANVIELGEGLDYAEGFDVSGQGEVEPGTVLVIDLDNPGTLSVSDRPYDLKVAGIVAGARGLGSGVRLGVDQYDYDVALAGRVYCYVDASEAGVEPGDLLTTSATPGYAMKVTDFDRAQGAILGKAMERLAKGERGLILVLVTLQ